MNRRISVSVSLAITIIAMTVTFSITWIISMNRFGETVRAVTDLQNQYTKLAEVDTLARGNYYGEIDEEYLSDRIIAGYMSGLGDRYSTYYTAEEYSNLLAIENGTLVGIGIEVVRDADGSFRIVKVYEDSPAAKAGVEVQGRIVGLNGEDAKSYSSARALQTALLGREGDELVLNCVYNVADESNFTILYTSNYAPPTVESQMAGDYAYIRISAFTSKTYADFDYVLRQVQNAGAKGIVFDVRGNSGGLFRNVYDAIDLLCPRGTVAKSVNKTGVWQVQATSDDNAVDLPMVALVDSNTSAAAELFAVSIRDLAGGQIVGTRTAGRGTLLSSPIRLQDGSAIVVTTAILYTGKDETFDGVGLAPDVEVEAEAATEEGLYNPNVNTDPYIRRALDVAQTLVRQRGEDPGTTISPDATLPPDSSSVPDDGPGTDGDDSTSGGDDPKGDNSSSDEGESSSSQA